MSVGLSYFSNYFQYSTKISNANLEVSINIKPLSLFLDIVQKEGVAISCNNGLPVTFVVSGTAARLRHKSRGGCRSQEKIVKVAVVTHTSTPSKDGNSPFLKNEKVLKL